MIDDGSSRSTDAGFTLLELLVALALMAVIATTMAVAVTQLRPMQAFQQRLEEREAADAIVDAIARDIKAATRLPLIEAGGSSSVLLRGEPQRIVFSAVVPTGYQRRALREVTYELAKAGVEVKLVRGLKLRRFMPVDHDASDQLALDRMSFRLAYLVVAEGGHRQWQDQFNELNSLPAAVLIELKLPDSKRVQSSRVIVLDRDAK